MQEPLNDFVARIKSLEIQGAKEIAVESLKWLRTFTRQKGFGKEFDHAVSKLVAARPTAVVLHNCVEALKANRSPKTIEKLLSDLSSSSKRIANTGSNLINDGCTIMIHCHSSEALGILKKAWADGKRFYVIGTETEPKLQGIKTVTELAAAKIPVSLITDSAVAAFMPKCDMVLVGTDAYRLEGIYNKTGTMFLALAAREFKKPFYIAANTYKLDRRKKIVIEERPPAEVYRPLKGVTIRNPAFELVPWKFVHRVITEKGIMTPGNVKRLLKE